MSTLGRRLRALLALDTSDQIPGESGAATPGGGSLKDPPGNEGREEGESNQQSETPTRFVGEEGVGGSRAEVTGLSLHNSLELGAVPSPKDETAQNTGNAKAASRSSTSHNMDFDDDDSDMFKEIDGLVCDEERSSQSFHTDPTSYSVPHGGYHARAEGSFEVLWWFGLKGYLPDFMSPQPRTSPSGRSWNSIGAPPGLTRPTHIGLWGLGLGLSAGQADPIQTGSPTTASWTEQTSKSALPMAGKYRAGQYVGHAESVSHYDNYVEFRASAIEKQSAGSALFARHVPTADLAHGLAEHSVTGEKTFSSPHCLYIISNSQTPATTFRAL
ncbi:hypothetical protein BDK51DRAFT_46618 [Blyttiomyces helicus]|uniref:Uncharacterized protein n=1 Tax=Blyttiomyces helicus TaxID=388810 RepID=A0A4P9WH80_9FUNG|nr:hypothetical protein BDK51DRAFT_46618 [Blyttiomyces helicus]|eukprot:RKO90420.1 hypothetical protein BDK51DRAFT_46618 [Blyttiomyces helicus]